MVEQRDSRMNQLIDGGEWACSWGDAGGLAQVCRQLAEITDPELADQARRIVYMLEHSSEDAAFQAWSALAASGRHRQAKA
jgi:hypothetical protein